LSLFAPGLASFKEDHASGEKKKKSIFGILPVGGGNSRLNVPGAMPVKMNNSSTNVKLNNSQGSLNISSKTSNLSDSNRNSVSSTDEPRSSFGCMVLYSRTWHWCIVELQNEISVKIIHESFFFEKQNSLALPANPGGRKQSALLTYMGDLDDQAISQLKQVRTFLSNSNENVVSKNRFASILMLC